MRDGRRRGLLVIPVLAIVVVVVIAFMNRPTPQQHFSSFEVDMEGWVADGTDLEHGNGTLEWSIARSQENAKDGSTSLRFHLNNLNDAGKIWIERAFDVKPNHTYQVAVEYAFASADFGDFNLWRIITGVLQESPETRDDLTPTYQDETGNGMSSASGHVWLDKRYEFTAQSGSDGTLWVVIGVWGTWETARTYYLDGVLVTLVGE